MRNTKPEDLGAVITRELTTYHNEVNEKINNVGRDAVKKLVKITKTKAPVGARGSFKRRIASREDDAGHGMKTFTWYVKAPDHRLTHLLVHGHATKDGGRTKGDPFLHNALNEVLPEYEQKVEEAVQGD